ALAPGRISLGGFVELEENVAEEFGRRTKPPDPALQAARADAPLWIGQGTDPAWLATFGPVNLGKPCEGARAARDVIRAAGFLNRTLPWLTGGALALFSVREGQGALEAVGIAAARTRDVDAVPKQPMVHAPQLADPVAFEPGPGDVRISIGRG